MCDTLVSIIDDGVLFAKNSDRDPNEAQSPRWYPAADHPDGSTVDCTWISVPQVAHTNAVLVSQPSWMWGAEMGTNEHGVTIGNEAVFTNAEEGDPALLGMDLLRLALERSTTAAEAVGVIVDLLERHGQGGPCSHQRPDFTYDNSFIVADPSGATVVETAGRQWAVEEVDGAGRSISNALTIPAFAEKHAKPLKARIATAHRRRSRTQSSAMAARGVADLFAALRDHGPTPSPEWSRVNGALGAPCVHAGGLITSTQSTASWVSDLRGIPLHWLTATSAPCTSVFHPFRVDAPADLGPVPGERFDPATRWWRHELLHRLCLRDHAASTARFADHVRRIEARWVDAPPDTEHALAVSAAAEQMWLDDLIEADLPDRRPRWLRRLWSRQNEAAGIAASRDGTALVTRARSVAVP